MYVVVVVVVVVITRLSPPVLEEVGSGVRRAQSSAVERPRKQRIFSSSGRLFHVLFSL